LQVAPVVDQRCRENAGESETVSHACALPERRLRHDVHVAGVVTLPPAAEQPAERVGSQQYAAPLHRSAMLADAAR
jgi:hypothetical protein